MYMTPQKKSSPSLSSLALVLFVLLGRKQQFVAHLHTACLLFLAKSRHRQEKRGEGDDEGNASNR